MRNNRLLTEEPIAILKYSYRAIQDLSLDDTEQINRFIGYYDAADKAPVKIATAHIQTP